MKKIVLIVVVLIVALAGVALYTGMFSSEPVESPGGQAGGGRGAGGREGGGGGNFGGGGGFGGGGTRPPMTVETDTAHRGSIMQQLVVVGNLVGDATVAVVPRAAGRLQEISVRLGDRVSRGQRIAKIEDFELQEQVKQQEAALEVSRATIRQREADLKLAETNAERSRNLFGRQLLPKQTLDDTEARYQAAVAQLDLARAQNNQSTARLDELRINLQNTVIVSPVDGFVARRAADPGAFVGQNAPVVDVVDIGRVRLVANIVEKDMASLQTGDDTQVGVDAFPGEVFTGRIARVAPVLDPATRTASIEIEIPNPGYRLKPGMYARVSILTDTTKDALVVPSDAVVDLGGRRGVFTPLNESAVFRALQIGTEAGNIVEILGGLAEGDVVVTTGAGALRDGDRILLPGGGGRRGGTANNGAGGRGGRDGAAGTGQGRQGREGAAAGATPAPGGAAAPSGGTAAEGGRRTGGDGSGRYGGRSGEGRGGREGRLGRDGRSGTEGRAEAPPSGGPAS